MQQKRPGTWSESTNDASPSRSERSEGRRVRLGEYGYNNPPYPYRPNYQRPYPFTVYPYDDAEDIPNYQQRQPYRPSPPRPYAPPPGCLQQPYTSPSQYPNSQQQQQQPYIPPPQYPNQQQPYIPQPQYPYQQQQPYMPASQLPSNTATPNPLAPIGYMLVDTYTSSLNKRSISIPRAFFKVND